MNLVTRTNKTTKFSFYTSTKE